MTSWDGIGSLVQFVLSLNLHRRHLNAGQRAAVAVEIEPLLAKEKEAKQKAQGDRGKEGGRGNKKETLGEIVPQGIAERAPKATEEAAALTGTSGRYVADAKKVKTQAPELLEKVKAGEMTLPQAKQEVRRQEKREEMQAKAEANLLTDGNQARDDQGASDNLAARGPLPRDQQHGGEMISLPFAVGDRVLDVVHDGWGTGTVADLRHQPGQVFADNVTYLIDWDDGSPSCTVRADDLVHV